MLSASPSSFGTSVQEQLRGEKCLVVLVGQKEGHMSRYGQKERQNKSNNNNN